MKHKHLLFSEKILKDYIAKQNFDFFQRVYYINACVIVGTSMMYTHIFTITISNSINKWHVNKIMGVKILNNNLIILQIHYSTILGIIYKKIDINNDIIYLIY